MMLLSMALWFLFVPNCIATTLVPETSTNTTPPHRVLHADNPFRENLAANISDVDIRANLEFINNPKISRITKKSPKVLEYRLNKSNDGSVTKRTTPSSPYNALIPFRNCLYCQGQARRDSTLSVEKNFMADQLIAKMILFATVGECIFYGQRPKTLWPPRSFSRVATKYACKYGGVRYRTIWQLWPGDEDNEDNCATDENYYCLDSETPKCCWLNPLIPSNNKDERLDQSMLYFRQMSRAMALTCAGDVYIMLDREGDVDKIQDGQKPSIWLTHELPVLQGLFRRNIVKSLKVIRYSDSEIFDKTEYLSGKANLQPRMVDGVEEWSDRDERMLKAIKAKKLELFKQYGNMSEERMAEMVHKRGACGSAVDQENPNLDYFG